MTITDRFIELAKLSSPSKQERLVADYILAFCKERQIAISEDAAGAAIGGNSGNLLATMPGKGARTVLFSAHMDTVVPCDKVHPVIRDGRIYSDQTTILGADDKSGIAAMLLLMEDALAHPDAYPHLKFVFSVAEETGLEGARQLDPSFLADVDAAFILDSSGQPGEIVCAAPFMASGTITVTGKEAHAGIAPEEGINAFVVAAKAVSKLQIGRIDANTTCNVGIVHGGLAANIVMPKITLEFEARSLDGAKLEQLLHQVDVVFQEECSAAKATYATTVAIDTPGYQITEQDEIAQKVVQASNTIGLPYRFKQSGGGSDTNIYAGKQVQAMTLATGMTKVHTVEESIAIEDLVKTAQWIQAIAKVYSI